MDAETNQEKAEETIRINYSSPKFHLRVLADVMDFLILAVIWILLFLGARGIANSTPAYKEAVSRSEKTQLASQLYKEEDGQHVTIVTYINANSSSYSSSEIIKAYDDAINGF